MQGKGLKVLVVDDEPQIQKLLKVSLGAHGYEMEEALTGEAGIRLAAHKTWCTGRCMRRIASAAEFAAAAAIAPLGCWAAGLFGAVRELSFP